MIEVTLEPQVFQQVFRRGQRRFLRDEGARVKVAWVVQRWTQRQIVRKFKGAGVAYGPIRIETDYDPATRQGVIVGWADVASPIPGHEGEIYVMPAFSGPFKVAQ